ncbi:MAG: hypothetical protein OXU68_07885 [Bacteroidota bacterium]|nr:hypothetical protein [Bacteroidota bacterium]MDE2956906.1 hypothetical protein [Bacteroidota bacterium]
MRLRKHAYTALWFAIPFVVGIGLFTGARAFFSTPATITAPNGGPEVNYPMLGQEISADKLIAPRTREPISEQTWSMPDAFIAILLGGVGCSGNQVAALRRWSELPPESQWSDYPVIAIYSDPLLGEETGIHDALVLRRISRARFPFFVSRDSTFSPGAAGLRTPQVVLVKSGRIADVLNVPATRRD